jgi:hypothetical protein
MILRTYLSALILYEGMSFFQRAQLWNAEIRMCIKFRARHEIFLKGRD